jgi:hypothetical protein
MKTLLGSAVVALVAMVALSALTPVRGAALDGSERGNGGDVLIAEPSGVRFLDGMTVPNQQPLVPQIEPGWAELLKALRKEPALSSTTIAYRWGDGRPSQTLANALRDTLQDRLKFILTVDEIPDGKDAGKVVFKAKIKGTIRRLAFQETNEQRVTVNREYFRQLSPRDQARFFIHEALIHLRHWSDVYREDTSAIRAFVQTLFDRTRTSPLIPRQVAEAMELAGILAGPGVHEGMCGISWPLNAYDLPQDSLKVLVHGEARIYDVVFTKPWVHSVSLSSPECGMALPAISIREFKVSSNSKPAGDGLFYISPAYSKTDQLGYLQCHYSFGLQFRGQVIGDDNVYENKRTFTVLLPDGQCTRTIPDSEPLP